MILLWGVPGDTPLANVRNALARLQHTVAFVDQHAILETEIELLVDPSIKGKVRVRNQVIDLNHVTAVYLRPYSSDQLPVMQGLGPDNPLWRHAIAVTDALLSWVELTPAYVVNRPSAMASNDSKPYQARLIQSVGFDVPETLITTDPEEVEAFWRRYDTIIYKSISGVRSIVSRLTTEQARRLDYVVWCPTQFQQYISGDDYRVHVVGEQIFACQIRSTADDYRYAAQQGISAELHACHIPHDVAERCRSLARTLHLSVAGIDLRHHPNGRWYCFEVNPSPAFSYYQNATGQPIADAIAHLLIAGRAPTDGEGT